MISDSRSNEGADEGIHGSISGSSCERGPSALLVIMRFGGDGGIGRNICDGDRRWKLDHTYEKPAIVVES